MSVSQKLKWKKLVNQLRYMHEEVEIVDEISNSVGGEFQTYYEDFCKKYNIDIAELNRKYAKRVKEAYGSEEEERAEAPLVPSEATSTALVPFQEENKENAHPATDSCDTTDEEAAAIHEVFSRLFKKLAVCLHPDKLTKTALTPAEKAEMLKMFTSAKSALEEKKYFILLDYAEKLKIPLPKNYRQQTKWMKKELPVLRDLIRHKMKSYNYMFAECETEESKDILIRQFLYQLFEETIL